MPKQKTNRSAVKRLKKTGGKTIRRNQTNRRHLLTSKNRKRKRHLRGTAAVAGADVRQVKRLLPGS
ncbi:MAG: 50S ribosomal protein L35 [Deltaproteobacteria bacterium]|nr:50S ribosomal protein L35 [Deltaproteobacteria bacterium]